MRESAIRSEVSPVAAAMEQNLFGHLSCIQSGTAGMLAQERGGVLLVDSGLATDTFNKIAAARLEPADADRGIASALAHFREAGRPFAWIVGPGSRPLDLEQRLERHGLRRAEAELGMAIDLAALPEEVHQPAGLEIRPVRTASDLEGFAEVMARCWDPPDPAVRDFFRRAAPLLLAGDCPMRLFTGWVEGTPAAGSELFVGGGAAGIHMVATRREYQRRGFGMALTWAALREGRDLGLSLGTLQASEEGQPVYRRLGFQPCGLFVEYQPAPGA